MALEQLNDLRLLGNQAYAASQLAQAEALYTQALAICTRQETEGSAVLPDESLLLCNRYV